MIPALRIGLVRYLNAKPLCYSLAGRLPQAELVTDLPSRLAAALAAGELDVAMIPSVEYLRGIKSCGYVALPGAAIATHGPVRSVKLLSHLPFGQIRRLALDEGSRTSQALCRVWLKGVHGVEPSILEELPIGMPPEESTADAVLVIGDRAMRLPEERFHAVVDLGEAWKNWTGLPFVFALWVAREREGLDLDRLSHVLNECRDTGLKNAVQIAMEQAPRLGLSVEECVFYLTQQLSYDLNEPELAGLRLFAAKAEAMGLVPEGSDVVIHRPRDFACRS